MLIYVSVVNYRPWQIVVDRHGQYMKDGGSKFGLWAFRHGPPSAIDNTDLYY